MVAYKNFETEKLLITPTTEEDAEFIPSYKRTDPVFLVPIDFQLAFRA